MLVKVYIKDLGASNLTAKNHSQLNDQGQNNHNQDLFPTLAKSQI